MIRSRSNSVRAAEHTETADGFPILLPTYRYVNSGSLKMIRYSRSRASCGRTVHLASFCIFVSRPFVHPNRGIAHTENPPSTVLRHRRFFLRPVHVWSLQVPHPPIAFLVTRPTSSSTRPFLHKFHPTCPANSIPSPLISSPRYPEKTST